MADPAGESERTGVSLSSGSMSPPTQLLFTSAITTAVHPFTCAKTLIQLGYEPIAPKHSKTMWGKEVWVLPGVFTYLGHIRKQDGFTGMYRGLAPRVFGSFIGSYVTSYVSAHLERKHPIPSEELDGLEPEMMDSIMKLVKESTYETVSRCAGLIAAQPFQVIMVRNIAQFVGGETSYSSIWSAVKEIYQEDGVLGFFVGLAPRLIGEALTIWMANFMAHLLNTYVLSKNSTTKDMKAYTGTLCAMGVTHLTYPFGLVSTNMAVHGTKLAAASLCPVRYNSWRDCWSHLGATNQLKRGSGLFFRYYKGPNLWSGVDLHFN